MERYASIMDEHPLLLTEGSVIERIRRVNRHHLDPHLENAPMVYDEEGSAVLAAIYREYIDIALPHGLPILILTPTWRASRERIERAGLAGRDVNRDCFEFVARIREGYGRRASRILIGGLMGCRGDAYDPADALTEPEARSYHAHQAERLAAAGVDLLVASTIPSAGEAAGLAAAMGRCGLPFFPSFIIRPNGLLLDGTRLADAVAAIDDGVAPKPTAYLLNCVHPANMRSALEAGPNGESAASGRLIGLQGNASRKSPEELEGSPELDADPPERWAREMISLHRDHGFRILGGCCGAGARHIERLAELCAREAGGDAVRKNSRSGRSGELGAVELPIDGTLDLHTFRSDEVKTLVPDYLAACRDRGITQVRIIHGKGTGALRETVHAILKRLPDVERFRLAGEDGGGWGATIVTLKDP